MLAGSLGADKTEWIKRSWLVSVCSGCTSKWRRVKSVVLYLFGTSSDFWISPLCRCVNFFYWSYSSTFNTASHFWRRAGNVEELTRWSHTALCRSLERMNRKWAALVSIHYSLSTVLLHVNNLCSDTAKPLFPSFSLSLAPALFSYSHTQLSSQTPSANFSVSL